ncbi:hypothetical protein Aperf_G00000102544 [Anoplocephala perfoliata]
MSAFIANIPAIFIDHSRHTEYFVNGILAASVVYLAIYVSFIISGAQINPMTTLVVVLSRRMPILFFPFYLTAQFVGTFLALLIGKFLSPFASSVTYSGMPLPALGVSDGQAIAMEIIITFLLELAILALLDELRQPNFHYLNRVNAFVVLIGVFFWIDTIAGPISGACANPIRSFAASILNTSFHRQYIYIVGPIIGASLAVLIQEAFLTPDASAARLRALINIRQPFDRHEYYSINADFSVLQNQTQNSNVKSKYFKTVSTSLTTATIKESATSDDYAYSRARKLFPMSSNAFKSRLSSFKSNDLPEVVVTKSSDHMDMKIHLFKITVPCKRLSMRSESSFPRYLLENDLDNGAHGGESLRAPSADPDFLLEVVRNINECF